MSDIKPGDMVIVVRGCCEKFIAKAVGIPYPVRSVERVQFLHCTDCGVRHNDVVAVSRADKERGSEPFWLLPRSFVRKLDPLDEGETTPTKEELHA